MNHLARLLADGLAQRGPDRKSMGAVALSHQGPGERLAVDGATNLHQPRVPNSSRTSSITTHVQMRPAGLTAVLLASLLLTVLPSRAAAEIRIQHGIAGVTLGMTRNQVTEILGPADRIAVSYLGESQIKYVRAYWDARKLRAAFIDTTEDTSELSTPGTSMLSIETRNRAQRTRSGIGVGSTEVAVRRGVRGAACTTYRGRRGCAVGDPGSRQTTFSITRGRVAAVSISDVF